MASPRHSARARARWRTYPNTMSGTTSVRAPASSLDALDILARAAALETSPSRSTSSSQGTRTHSLASEHEIRRRLERTAPAAPSSREEDRVTATAWPVAAPSRATRSPAGRHTDACFLDALLGREASPPPRARPPRLKLAPRHIADPLSLVSDAAVRDVRDRVAKAASDLCPAGGCGRGDAPHSSPQRPSRNGAVESHTLGDLSRGTTPPRAFSHRQPSERVDFDLGVGGIDFGGVGGGRSRSRSLGDDPLLSPPPPPVTVSRGLHPGVHELGTLAAKEMESLHRLAPLSESDGGWSDDEEGSAWAARRDPAEELMFELDGEFGTSPQGVKSHSPLPLRRLRLPAFHMPFARR